MPGQNVTLNVTASGDGLSYQWRKGTVDLSDGGSLSGSNTSSMTLTNVGTNEAGGYNCVVTGSCGPAATSANATLTLISQPTITSQPTNVIRTSGQSAVFSLVATGATGYQWRRGPLT